MPYVMFQGKIFRIEFLFRKNQTLLRDYYLTAEKSLQFDYLLSASPNEVKQESQRFAVTQMDGEKLSLLRQFLEILSTNDTILMNSPMVQVSNKGYVFLEKSTLPGRDFASYFFQRENHNKEKKIRELSMISLRNDDFYLDWLQKETKQEQIRLHGICILNDDQVKGIHPATKTEFANAMNQVTYVSLDTKLRSKYSRLYHSIYKKSICVSVNPFLEFSLIYDFLKKHQF